VGETLLQDRIAKVCLFDRQDRLKIKEGQPPFENTFFKLPPHWRESILADERPMINFRSCSDFGLLAGYLGLLCILGCEAETTAPPRTTSHDDIVSFLEENPEFATPSQPPSGSSELGLER
jgi:hypothetical protein